MDFRVLLGCDMHGSARCLPLLATVALVALLAAPGCTRHDWRERADKDVEGVISQKNVFEAWQVRNWHAYPDPRARFADNSNPDRPPYPPDDYAARLLSPNPQKPTKKSGVGRVDGDGYIGLLEKWDAENRGWDPVPAAGAAAKASAFAPPTAVAAAQGAQPLPAKPSTQWKGPPAIPAPTLAVGDRPAVRHAPPPGTPAALLPAGGPLTASVPPTPAPASQVQAAQASAPAVPPAATDWAASTGGTAPATPPAAPATPSVAPATFTTSPTEFGPWMPARPRLPIPGPVVMDRGNGPTITELRPPTVIVVAGEVNQNGKAIPAIAVIPTAEPPSAQPPEKLPNPLPVPGPMVPKQPEMKAPDPGKGGIPMGQGPGAPGGPPAAMLTAAGDSAADYLRALESGQVGYRIKLEQALELAFLNAREFQDRREDLYLAALPVTLARFNFASQAFFTEQVVRQSTGRDLTNGGERWTANTTAGVSKLFPTGAMLMAKLANQVVIDLSGEKPTTAVSNATLSLAQPLLRGGGYAVTLESLTQAERNLLYAMRSYARFRKLFYVAIAAGGNYTNNPYGLQGLAANLGRGIGNNLTAVNVGFLPILQQQAIINNQRRNVTALERLLRLYQAFYEGGQQSPLQVGQVELQLLGSRTTLLNGQGGTPGMRQYMDTLDNFKLQLGLPVTVPLEFDDGPLKPIRQQLARYDELFAQARAVELEGSKYNRAEAVAEFRKRWLKLFTTAPLVQGTAFAKDIADRWATWAPDKLTEQQVRDRLAKLREDRRKILDAKVEREVRNQTAVKKEPDPPGENERLTKLSADIDLGELELNVREYEAQPWAKKTGKERDVIQDNAFTAAFNAFLTVVLEAQNERLDKLSRNWPTLASLPVAGRDVLDVSLDEGYTAAIQTALTDRLDLMNARAQVVDAWRQIAVTANSLQGVFDVRYDLNSSTPPNGSNVFGFSGTRSTSQVTFNAQLPLVRRAERNNYRAALIAYQRQRRTLMAFEDNIVNDVRSDVRDLRTFAQLYRIQQRVVELQYAQVDNAQAILFAPPVPGAGSDAGSAAALTQQVLQAQNNLVSAQNSLFQIWVSYLTARMSFYLDLELMQLDDRGVWYNEFPDRIDLQARPYGQPQFPFQPGGGERLHTPRPIGNEGR